MAGHPTRQREAGAWRLNGSVVMFVFLGFRFFVFQFRSRFQALNAVRPIFNDTGAHVFDTQICSILVKSNSNVYLERTSFRRNT